MPAEARKGPVVPESKKSVKDQGSSTPQGPRAFRGPQVAPEVLVDAQRAEAKKAATPSVAFIPSESPSKPDQAVKQGLPGTPAQPFGAEEVRTTDTGAELGGTPSSRSPEPDDSVWQPHPEVRFDPGNPFVQAQTMVQPATGAVAEKLVGPGVDSHLRPAGSPLPAAESNPPSAEAGAADTTAVPATEGLDQA